MVKLPKRISILGSRAPEKVEGKIIKRNTSLFNGLIDIYRLASRQKGASLLLTTLCIVLVLNIIHKE